MGKKAKLKQQRKSSELNLENQLQNQGNFDPNQFVKNLEKQGYSLKKIQRAPQLPKKGSEPQV